MSDSTERLPQRARSVFLTDIARIDLRLVSTFRLIVAVPDVVNDPLIGFLSDRTRKEEP